VILPRANEIDLDEVPEEIRNELTFVLVEHVSEVLDVALARSVPFQAESQQLDAEELSLGGNGRSRSPSGAPVHD